MFSWLERRAVDARGIVGNAVVGNVSGTLIQNFIAGAPPSQPSLPWTELPGEPDFFRLLNWRARLVSLVGRESQTDLILDWARNAGTSRPRIRFLTGPGGAGKSRLAAEVAQILKDQGWTGGFHHVDKPVVLPVTRQGLFLVVDYIEEHVREATVALFRELANSSELPAPICLLVLSRREMVWWQRTIDAAHAEHICDTLEIGISMLDAPGAVAVVRNATETLVELYRQGTIPREEDVRQWYATDPQFHGLPLIATAAALHTVLEPMETLRLTGGAIVRALVRRERLRIDNAGRTAGLGEHGASRLIALAAVGGSLDATVVGRLADPNLALGLPPPERAVDAVAALPWWQNDRLTSVTPDIVAASLLVDVLAERPDMAPEWLWIVIEDQSLEVIPLRIDRLAYDLVTLHGPEEQRLNKWLQDMVVFDIARARKLSPLTEGDATGFGIRGLAETVCWVLVYRSSTTKETRASLLNRLSELLGARGAYKDALDAIRIAMGLYHQLLADNLDRHASGFAMAAHSMSNALAKVGDHESALDTARRTVDLYRMLTEDNPGRFTSELAESLNTVAVFLVDAKRATDARKPIREALRIQRSLAHKDPARFESGLATTLTNLSVVLAETGHPGLALKVTRKAVAVYGRLAQEQPWQFESLLAGNLLNVSNRLAELGHPDSALREIRKAHDIYERLAAASPGRFEPELAKCLSNLSIRLAQAGQDDALDVLRRCIEITRRWVERAPKRFELELANSLELLALFLDGTDAPACAEQARHEAKELRAKTVHCHNAL